MGRGAEWGMFTVQRTGAGVGEDPGDGGEQRERLRRCGTEEVFVTSNIERLN